MYTLEFNTKTMHLLLHGLSKALAQHVPFAYLAQTSRALEKPSNKLTTSQHNKLINGLSHIYVELPFKQTGTKIYISITCN